MLDVIEEEEFAVQITLVKALGVLAENGDADVVECLLGYIDDSASVNFLLEAMQSLALVRLPASPSIHTIPPGFCTQSQRHKHALSLFFYLACPYSVTILHRHRKVGSRGDVKLCAKFLSYINNRSAAVRLQAIEALGFLTGTTYTITHCPHILLACLRSGTKKVTHIGNVFFSSSSSFSSIFCILQVLFSDAHRLVLPRHLPAEVCELRRKPVKDLNAALMANDLIQIQSTRRLSDHWPMLLMQVRVSMRMSQAQTEMCAGRAKQP